jgi:hypothetical protein
MLLGIDTARDGLIGETVHLRLQKLVGQLVDAIEKVDRLATGYQIFVVSIDRQRFCSVLGI